MKRMVYKLFDIISSTTLTAARTAGKTTAILKKSPTKFMEVVQGTVPPKKNYDGSASDTDDTSLLIPGTGFADMVESECGQNIMSCEQCGGCTAACPVAPFMEFVPRRIVQMIQLNMKEQILCSDSIWLCTYCYACADCCPRGIDLTRIIDTLRIMAQIQGTVASRNTGLLFNKVFWALIERYGRLYEAELVLHHNLWSQNFFKDAGKLVPMLLKDKVNLPDHSMNDDQEVGNLLSHIMEENR